MDDVNASRVRREREFHNRRFDGSDSREDQKKFYWAIWDGAQRYMDTVADYAAGTDVLEYGCGDADNWARISPLAKTLTGIDISDAAIVRLKAECHHRNTTYLVMDAHELAFDDNAFDLVFGSGIIHHLDTRRAAAEIGRVLRPGGRAVFWEPLGMNPIINAYRSTTPAARTPDEHPMMPEDYVTMGSAIGTPALQFYGLTTLLSVPLAGTGLRYPAFKVFRWIDRVVAAVPGVRFFSWYCLSEFVKP